MLTISNLTKRYGKKTAVNRISLEINAGDIVGFIGHNGAGKTTTLRCCSGILEPDEGDIRIDGLSLRESPLECKRRLAYIPDNPDLYEYLTGIRYLNFVADVYGVSAADRASRIERYATMFEIRNDLADPIRQYSHGMKQKIALISALIHEPKLIMLDEPFVGLDPVAAHRIKTVMRQMCDAGGAIFFSTHVLEVAEKLCDKIAIIRQGEIVVSGDTETVRGDSSLENVFLELAENHV
ncbi:MAG TPA: ABC transporter ATP-binding protein [Clostridiaceae bacterium]|nr:ABC transporter ATP-binding protein [Clostridiaceae bacterium]